MDSIEVLRVVQAGLYVTLGVAALRVWQRDRGRPAAYLAAAFVSLALVTLLSVLFARLEPDALAPIRDLNVVLVLAFPWLLAAFAWSFTEDRLPRWLELAAVAQAVLAAVVIALPTLGEAGERSGGARVVVFAVLTAWLTLVVAAAIRLWLAGTGQPRAVRSRTRSMAAGAIGIGIVLLMAANSPGDSGPVALAIAVGNIAAALLFGMGFAPPLPLRWWWRQLPAGQVQAMQVKLIAATSPDDVAAAIVPTMAEMYGAGALLVDPSGRLMAAAGLEDEEATRLAEQVHGGVADRLTRVRSLEAEGYRLAVQISPYAPVFGAEEEDLLHQFVMQLRLALQRTALSAATEAARSAMQRAYDDQQAVLIGLAHDLRSPTVTIAAYGALIADAKDLREAHDMAASMARAAGYLDRLVDGLSALSRIGRNDGEPEPVRLHDLVDNAATRLQATYPGLRLEVEGALPVLMVDPLRIEQVFDNLLGNAAKHGGRTDLTVVVSARPTAAGVLIVVADDGTGLPEEEHEEVFTLFRRGSGADGEGSGVGLGLVRRIVESYGGRIRLVRAPVGARAEIELPASLVVDDGADRNRPDQAAVDDGAAIHRPDGADVGAGDRHARAD